MGGMSLICILMLGICIVMYMEFTNQTEGFGGYQSLYSNDGIQDVDIIAPDNTKYIADPNMIKRMYPWHMASRGIGKFIYQNDDIGDEYTE